MSGEPSFLSQLKPSFKKEPAWLSKSRKEAFQYFEDSGLPKTSNENWIHTNVSAIGKETYQLPPTNQYQVRKSNLPKGVEVLSVAELIQKKPEVFKKYFQNKLNDPFSALNASLFQDGFFVFVPKNTTVEEPIEFIFETKTNGHSLITSPRNVIVAEGGSKVTIVETFISSGKSLAWVNSFTDVHVLENASVLHIKYQNEASKNFHIGTVTTHQERNSQFHSIAIHLGGKLVRSNTQTKFGAEGGECTMNGLFITSGDQHTDNHTVIDHAQPHCTSKELYKGILTGKSRGVFDGKMIVRKDAQKTNAKQSSKNLLLSEDAWIDTTPRLEIYADDVKCAHGATIGSLDEDALFYFRSRGIDELSAKRILTYAFANEIVQEIPHIELRDRIAKEVEARLNEVNR